MRAPKLADRVVADISNCIHNGTLSPGAKLPTEHEFMQRHGVSRAVVREAMSRLHAAGMVESRQGVGTFVLEKVKGANVPLDTATVLTMRDVLALLELRLSVETEAAALAAVRRSPMQLERMQSCVDRIQAELDSGREETTEADFEFHLAIASATENRYFVQVLNFFGLAILPRTRVDVRYMATRSATEYLNRSNDEHRAILRAIAGGDSEGARAAMRTHLSNSRTRLQQLAGADSESLG